MKLKIYSIYDSKTETYAIPNFILNKGTFTRALLEAMNDPNSQLSKYPADFTAFEIGEWDDSNGTVTMYSAKVNLGCLLEFKTPDHQSKVAFADRIEQVQQHLTQEGNH